MPTGLLIASPSLRDPNFSRTVVLMCQHDSSGALGLVINRDGPVTIGAVAEQLSLDAPLLPDDPTWWGGPVGPGTGFVIWRGQIEGDEGWNIGAEIAVSPSADRLERLIHDGELFHLALGYAGWGPGQLDEEIQQGSWIYAEVEPEIVLEAALDDRWKVALERLGLDPEMFWSAPADA